MLRRHLLVLVEWLNLASNPPVLQKYAFRIRLKVRSVIVEIYNFRIFHLVGRTVALKASDIALVLLFVEADIALHAAHLL